MGNAAIKVICYLLIIVLGYLLKKAKVFRTEHADVLSMIFMNITLPCVIITSFQAVSLTSAFVVVIAVGLLYNLFMLGLGTFIGKRTKDKKEGLLYGLMVPCQNIGVFGSPIVQACFPPIVLVATFLFDIGNSTVLFGPSCVMASVRSEGARITPASVIKKLLSTAAFDAYILMIILAVLNLKLPAPVITFAGICGAGNGFLAMLFFGIIFEPKFEKPDKRLVIRILGIRLAVGALAAVLLWNILPIEPELRIAIVICLAMPVATASAIFASTLDCKRSQISGASTVSLAVSAVLALLLAAVLA